MDFGALAQSIADQFVTVRNAPVPFLTACIALWFGLRWFVRGQFETRLANAASTIEMLEKQIDRNEVRLEIERPNFPPPAELAPRDSSVEVPEAAQDFPARLIALYRSHTKIQAADIMKEHLGSSITITGTVNNVSEPYSDGRVTVSLTKEDNLSFCTFEKATDRIRGLRKNDKITVCGKLEEVSSFGLELKECQIL
jgi:tRNA_anti-like